MKSWVYFLLLLSYVGAADQFCDGFEAGYKAGYCYQKYSCLEPLAPLCPLRSLSDQDGYSGGFSRGFVAGQAKRADRENAIPATTFSQPYRSHSFYEQNNQAMQNFGSAVAEGIRAYQERKRADALLDQQRQFDSLQRINDSLDIEIKRRKLERLKREQAADEHPSVEYGPWPEEK